MDSIPDASSTAQMKCALRVWKFQNYCFENKNCVQIKSILVKTGNTLASVRCGSGLSVLLRLRKKMTLILQRIINVSEHRPWRSWDSTLCAAASALCPPAHRQSTGLAANCGLFRNG